MDTRLNHKRPCPGAPKGARDLGHGTYDGPIKGLGGETALLLTDPSDGLHLFAQFDEHDLEHPLKPGLMLAFGWSWWNRKHWEIDEYAHEDGPQEGEALTDEEFADCYTPQHNR